MHGKAGSIVMFLGDLPLEVTAKLLRSFVQQGIQGLGPARSRTCGHICHCSILRVTNLDNGRVEMHGLAEIRPAVLAMHAIERLNGAKLLGKRVVARPYRQRSPIVRLQQIARPGSAQITEADLWTTERRRGNLKVELVDSDHGLLGGLRSSLQRPWWFLHSNKAIEGPAAS